jgi:hypothetical protein
MCSEDGCLYVCTPPCTQDEDCLRGACVLRDYVVADRQRVAARTLPRLGPFLSGGIMDVGEGPWPHAALGGLARKNFLPWLGVRGRVGMVLAPALVSVLRAPPEHGSKIEFKGTYYGALADVSLSFQRGRLYLGPMLWALYGNSPSGASGDGLKVGFGGEIGMYAGRREQVDITFFRLELTHLGTLDREDAVMVSGGIAWGFCNWPGDGS